LTPYLFNIFVADFICCIDVWYNDWKDVDTWFVVCIWLNSWLISS
jgi:hypothetical protein